MNKKLKKITIFLGIVFVFFLKAWPAQALEVQYPSILGKSLTDSSTIGDFLCYLFSTGVSLSISITALTIVFGGIYYLISYGRGNFTSEGKDWIKAGISGLLIIVCSSLIIYTINPNMGTCKVAFLPQLNIISLSSTDTTVPSGAIVATYNEIPIGILTENLLTRTSVCMAYNKYGDIMNPSITQETGSNAQPEPDNKDDTAQDRVACLRQAVEGAQKKANVVALLSDEITKLMDTCSCRIKDANGKDTGKSKCDPTCDPANGGCKVMGSCPGGSCGGDCIAGSCKQPENTTDCCPAGVLNKIEHGPIFIHINASQDPSEYGDVGADGQPCQKACSQDSDCLTAIVGSTNGKPNIIQVEQCDPDTHTCGKKYNGLDEFRCDENQNNSGPTGGQNDLNQTDKKCSDIIKLINAGGSKQGQNKITGVDAIKYFELTLWQQLKFMQELTSKWYQSSGFQSDIGNLQTARAALGKCYLAIPSVDFVNTNTVFSQQDRVVIRKQSDLIDSTSGKTIDSSKYCTGFNYNNSQCFKICNDACPDSSQEALDAYKNCGSGGSGSGDESCIENAYKSRPCPNGDGTSSTFADCVSNCQDTCNKACKIEYPSCSPEYNFCKSQCTDNGQCVLDNAGKCLFGAEDFAFCANKDSSDKSNTAYCIDNAYTCKNGSNENAGYKDCVSNSSSSSCSSFTTSDDCLSAGGIKGQCVWSGPFCSGPPNANCYNGSGSESDCTGLSSCKWQIGTCSQDYSASFIYKNPGNQKCTDAYSPASSGSCKSSDGSSCQTVCPETSKCPTASDCPTCPCSKIDQPVNFYIPNISTAASEVNCTDNSNCFSDQICLPNCPPGEECQNKICMSNGKKDTACTSNSDCSAEHETCSITDGESKFCVTNAGKEGSTWQKSDVSAYQMVGPQCNGFSYNDDPLTFYCEDNWWNDPQKEKSTSAIGIEKICNKGGDIPVGQAVDNAISWANNLASATEIVNKDIQSVLDQMTKIGSAKDTEPIKDYCKCDAQFGNNEPICQTNCKYSEKWIPPAPADNSGGGSDNSGGGDGGGDNGGNIDNGGGDNGGGDNGGGDGGGGGGGDSGYNNSFKYAAANFANKNSIFLTQASVNSDSGDSASASGYWQCSCNLEPCKGSPCQQMVDYHSQLWNFYKQFKTDFTSFNTSIVLEPRSDILKELTYSRQQADSCSLTNTIYGANTRLLNCTRAEDELLPPINQDKINFDNKDWPGYCYGQKLGQVDNKDLTDDWFCCQEWNKTPTTNDNPIYNIDNNNI
jgi:hypothetical protein